jgi:glycosyltransferase involved in cell wall biosynthesis
MKISNKCTLIISTYNWPQALNLVLMSLLEQTVLPYEVIIADDGSRDETRVLIDSYKKILPVPLLHVWHEDIGFRKTIILNKAFAQAGSDYIIQVDGDIMLHKNFVEDHLRHRKKGHFIKGSRGRLNKKLTERILNDKKISLCSLTPGVKSTINATRFPLLAPIFYKDDNLSRNVKGCNFAVWKNDFISVNGYDNDISGWGHEDIDLAARLINAGIKRRQLKMTAVCYHLHHEILSRNKEAENLDRYHEVVLNKVRACKNGYKQLNAD